MNHRKYIKASRVLGLAALLSSTYCFSADTGGVLLAVKPKKCIALHKGQTCYQKLKFTWSLPKKGQFCLHQYQVNRPVICWANNDLQAYKVQFESNKSERYQIRHEGSSVVLAEVKVRLATVYKQGKKSYSGWRLF